MDYNAQNPPARGCLIGIHAFLQKKVYYSSIEKLPLGAFPNLKACGVFGAL